MPTLTINGTLITELAELKKELGKINDAQSYTARAVRTHFHTGALQEWLNEGDENEQRMAAEISRIDRQQGDSDLLNNIVSIICEESAQVIATDPSRYLSLEGVAYSYGTPDGPQEGQLNSDTITLQEGVDGISLMVTFKVQESCNESFEVSINAQDKNTNNKKVLAKERVNLSDYPKGKLKKFFFYCAKEDAEEYELNICVDNTKVKSFGLKFWDGRFIVGGVPFKMKKVEGGTFTMGATSEMKNLLIDFYMNLLYISKEEFEVLKKNASTMLKQDLLKLSSEIRDNLLHSEDLKNMCAKNPSVSEDFNTLISEIRDYQQSIINTICSEELQSIDPNTIEINDFQNAKSSLVELSQTEIEMWSSLWENVENSLPKNGSVEQHISSLKTSVANCKYGKYTVMLMGEFQTGKTTTLNALCDGHYIGSVGIGTATTAVPVSVSYGESARVNIQWKNEDELKDMILHIKHLCSNNLFDNFVLSDKRSRSKLFSEIRLIIESKRDKLTSDEQKFLCVSYIILKYYNSAELQNLLGTECGIYNIAKFSKFPDDFEKNFNTYDVEDCLFVFIKQIDCFIPSKTLKQLECTIVDCPGLFKNQFDTEVTVDLMTRAHAIFYILPYHKAMDEKNCESLYTLKHSYKSFHRKIFLVNNLNSAKAGFFRQNVSEIHRLFGESTQLLPYDAHMALLGRIRDAYDSNSLDAKEIEMLLTKQESAFDFETLSFGSFKSDVNFDSWWNDEISTYKKINKWDSIPVSENIVKQSGFSKVLDSLRSFIENNESLSVIWSQGIGKFWDELDDIKSSYKKTYVSPCLNGGEQEKTKWEERIAKAKTFQVTVNSKTDEHIGDLSDEKSLSSLMARKEYENLFTEEFYSDLCNQIASAIYDQKSVLLSKKVIDVLKKLNKGALEKRVIELFSPIIDSLVQDIFSKQVGLRLNYWYKTWNSGQDEIFNTMFRPAVKTLKFDLEKEWNDLFYGDKDIKMKDYLKLDETVGNHISEKSINGEASVSMVEILSAYGKLIMNIVSIISSIVVIILCYIILGASNPVGWVAVALAGVGYLLVTMFKGPDTIKNEFVEAVSGQIKQQFKENDTYNQFRELVNHGVEDRINNFRNSLIVDVEKMEHEMIIALSTPESEKENKCFAAIELFEIIKRQYEIYNRFFEKFGCKAK